MLSRVSREQLPKSMEHLPATREQVAVTSEKPAMCLLAKKKKKVVSQNSKFRAFGANAAVRKPARESQRPRSCSEVNQVDSLCYRPGFQKTLHGGGRCSALRSVTSVTKENKHVAIASHVALTLLTGVNHASNLDLHAQGTRQRFHGPVSHRGVWRLALVNRPGALGLTVFSSRVRPSQRNDCAERRQRALVRPGRIAGGLFAPVGSRPLQRHKFAGVHHAGM